MTEMRKLKVLVFEEHIDAVLRFLGELGVAQFIDVREQIENWEGSLTPYEASTEAISRSSTLLSRISNNLSKIDELLKPIGIELEKVSSEKAITSKNRTEEVLDEIEQKIIELEQKLSLEEERIGEISTNFKERQTLQNKLKSLIDSSEKMILEKELQDLEKQITESKSAIKKELSLHKILTIMNKRAVELEKQIVEIKPFLGKIREDLITIEEATQMERSLNEQKTQFARTAKTVYFEAYVPSLHIDIAITKIKEATQGNCIITEEAPLHTEKVPTILKPTPSYMKAFEKLTFAFGYPSGDEVNPVRIEAITFPILFGIMFADVGQGVLLVLFGILFSIVKRKIDLEEVSDIIRYVLEGSEMFILWGISTTFFGFLFGEFFGPSGFIHPVSLGKFGPFYIGGFEPMSEPMKMLRLSVLIGVLHLSIGLIIRSVNEIKIRHYRHLSVPICWLWLLWGGFFMWAYWGGISNISKWFAEGLYMLLGIILLPLILLILFTGIAEGFMEGLGFGVEVFAETLSHTMSYCRLMALGLVHGVMNYLFLVLGGVEHGIFPPSSIPIIAIGTILVMIIEGLVVFVHTLRLHWVEWFSKFYHGEGIPYKPFKLENID